jgi:Rieske Fe-S protein
MSADQTDQLATADPTDERGLTRRRVLQGAAAVGVFGVAGTVLAACGGDDPASTTPTGSADPTESGTGGGAAALATTADVPVGGGLILEDDKIVLTQPTEGDFKAFTAVCTHQGCTVGSVTDNVIVCPCHGSRYDAATGENVGPPAAAPLAAIEIAVDGDQITLA